MQLPRLQTRNTDVSNALFRLADDEQRRRVADEWTVMRQLEAENRLMERSVLAEQQRSISAEREARNALQVHKTNMQKAQNAREMDNLFSSALPRIRYEDYDVFRGKMSELGAPDELMPSGFKSQEDFEKWKTVSIDTLAKSKAGVEFIYKTVVNSETGERQVIPIEKGKVGRVEDFFSEPEKWNIEGSGKEPKGYDPVTAEEIIVKNKDDVQLIMPKVREFNEKADVDYIYTTEKKKGMNPFSDAKEILTTRKLPVFNGRQLTKQDIKDYAKSRKMSFQSALDRFIELENNTMSKPKSFTLKAPSNAVTFDNIGK